MVESKAETEENEEAVVLVGHAAVQPHAVVVKSSVATLTQFAVFCPLRDHNLRERGEREVYKKSGRRKGKIYRGWEEWREG